MNRKYNIAMAALAVYTAFFAAGCGKNELPQRQPEEDILLVVPYLPVDFDLHCRHPLSGAFFTGRLGWMAVGLSPLSGRRKSIRAAA